MLTEHQRRRTLTVPEAARLLGVSPSTAYERIVTGDFPIATLRIGRRVVVPRAALAAALNLSPDDLDALLAAADRAQGR